MTHVEIGYNRRCYATFKIQDPTPEELDVLRANVQSDYNTEAFDLLQAMDAAGRLTEVEEAHEDGPEIFVERVEPNIIGVEDEEEER